MPIRVPTIVSQQGLDIGTVPQIGDTAGADYATGINQAINQIDQAARTYAHVNAQLTKQDMKLDVDSKLTQVKDRLSQEDANMRGEGIEPDQLAPEYQKRGMKAISDVAKDLHYPASAKEFQVRAEAILGQEVIKQRGRALDIKFARSSVNAELSIQESVNGAVFEDDPVKREAWTKKALGTVDGMMTDGVWGKDHATARTAKILEDISLGRAERLFQDPDKQATIVDQMLNGKLLYVEPTKQMDTAKRWLKESQERDTQRDARVKANWERDQEDNIRQYTAMAQDKTVTIPEFRRNADQWQWKATEVDRVYAILTAPAKEEPSDPRILEIARADANSAYPKWSDRTLLSFGPKSIGGTGQLNSKDLTALQDRRLATFRYNEGQALTQTDRAYAQGLARIKSSLGIPDRIEDAIDDKRIGIWNEARTAYDLRAAGAQGKEDPNKVSEQVIAQYQPMLGRQNITELSQLEGNIKYKTLAELEAARTRPVNPISDGEFKAQRRLMDRYNQLWNQNVVDQAKKQGAEQKTIAPQSSGGGFFQRTPNAPPTSIKRP